MNNINQGIMKEEVARRKKWALSDLLIRHRCCDLFWKLFLNSFLKTNFKI